MNAQGEVYVYIGLDRSGRIIEVRRADSREPVERAKAPCGKYETVGTLELRRCHDKNPTGNKPQKPTPPEPQPPNGSKNDPCWVCDHFGNCWCYCPPEDCYEG